MSIFTGFAQTTFLLLTSSLFAMQLSFAETEIPPPTTPIHITGCDLITPHEAATLLQKNIDSKNAEDKTLFVDVRKLIEFSEEHIPGAIYLPYHEKSAKKPQFDASQDRFDTSDIQLSKAKSVVFYCNGEQCWKSYKACIWLLKENTSKKIYWLRDGMPGWRAKKLPLETGITRKT